MISKHKTKPARRTPGTLLAEKLRSESNQLTDSQRAKLSDEFMKLWLLQSSEYSK